MNHIGNREWFGAFLGVIIFFLQGDGEIDVHQRRSNRPVGGLPLKLTDRHASIHAATIEDVMPTGQLKATEADNKAESAITATAHRRNRNLVNIVALLGESTPALRVNAVDGSVFHVAETILEQPAVTANFLLVGVRDGRVRVRYLNSLRLFCIHLIFGS